MAAKKQKTKSKRPSPPVQSSSRVRSGPNRHRAKYGGDSRNVWVRVAVPGRGQALHVGEGNMLLELFPLIASTIAMFSFLVLTAK
jgi:hypothetical protein